MRVKAACAIVLCLLVAPCSVVAQVISTHVFHVLASGCIAYPEDRDLTAVRIKGYQGLLTALHGVVGCRTIAAFQPDSNERFLEMQITRADLDNDVALISSTEIKSPFKTGYEPLRQLPEQFQTLRVIGFPLNTKGVISTTVTVRQGTITTWANMDSKTISRLLKRGSPNVNARMLSIQGHFLPGHSGAPVLDRQDRVVAIAIGGLAEGHAEISLASLFLELNLQQNLGERLKELSSKPIADLFALSGESESEALRKRLREQLGILYSRENYLKAVDEGDEEVLDLFLRIGIEPDARPKGEDSALYRAVKARRASMVRRLLAAGADPNLRPNLGRGTPLQVAMYGQDYETIGALLESPRTEINKPDDAGVAPLVRAAGSGDIALLKALLKRVDLDISRWGTEALLHASTKRSQNVINELVAVGIPLCPTMITLVDRYDEYQENDSTELSIQPLLDTNREVINCLTEDADTMLMLSARRNKPGVIQALIKAGANPKQPHKRSGADALSIAFESKSVDAAIALLNNGASFRNGIPLRNQPRKLTDADMTTNLKRFEKAMPFKNWLPSLVVASPTPTLENGDPVIVDAANALMWEPGTTEPPDWSQHRGELGCDEMLRKEFGGCRNEKDAAYYLKELNRLRYAGHNDWRLPTTDELLSTVSPVETLSCGYPSIKTNPIDRLEEDLRRKRTRQYRAFTDLSGCEYRKLLSADEVAGIPPFPESCWSCLHWCLWDDKITSCFEPFGVRPASEHAIYIRAVRTIQ